MNHESLLQICLGIVTNGLENPSVRIAAMNILHAIAATHVTGAGSPQFQHTSPAAPATPNIIPDILRDTPFEEPFDPQSVTVPLFGGPPVPLRSPTPPEATS